MTKWKRLWGFRGDLELGSTAPSPPRHSCALAQPGNGFVSYISFLASLATEQGWITNYLKGKRGPLHLACCSSPSKLIKSLSPQLAPSESGWYRNLGPWVLIIHGPILPVVWKKIPELAETSWLFQDILAFDNFQEKQEIVTKDTDLGVKQA